MKVTLFSTFFSLAYLVASTTAQLTYGPFPHVVQLGQTYTFTWTATDNYSYTIWLVRAVQGNPYTWDTRIATLAAGLTFNTLNGNLTWTVPTNLNVTDRYGLFFEGFGTSTNLTKGTMGQTRFFTVTSPGTPTASGSPTSSTSTSHSSGTSGTSGSGTSLPSSSQHASLSGGAIAGIVIGLLLLFALVAGGVVFCLWRRKRTGIQKREAAARATRLEPVMPKGSYEMYSRKP